MASSNLLLIAATVFLVWMSCGQCQATSRDGDLPPLTVTLLDEGGAQHESTSGEGHNYSPSDGRSTITFHLDPVWPIRQSEHSPYEDASSPETRSVDPEPRRRSMVKRNWKRNDGHSLSVVNPVDVLRQRMLMDVARERMRQNQNQIEANAQLLNQIGKRHSSPVMWRQQRHRMRRGAQVSAAEDAIKVETS